MVLSFFSCMCWLLACPLWKKWPFRSFSNQIVFFLLLSSMSCLLNLHINPLPDRWFVNILFHYIGCLLILLIVSYGLPSFGVWFSPIHLLFPLVPVTLVSYSRIISNTNEKKLFPFSHNILRALQFQALCFSL